MHPTSLSTCSHCQGSMLLKQHSYGIVERQLRDYITARKPGTAVLIASYAEANACQIPFCPHCSDGSALRDYMATNTAYIAALDAHKQQRVQRFRRYSRMPSSFASKTIASMDAPSAKLASQLLEQLDAARRDGRGTGAYLYGNVGTGKTFMASALGNALMDAGVSVVYANEIDLIRALQDGFNDAGLEEKNRKLRHAINTCDMLILDDLGKAKHSPWWTEQLYYIVNTRYEEKLPIIATSTLTLDALAKHLESQDIASRLLERSIQLQIAGASRRIPPTLTPRAYVD